MSEFIRAGATQTLNYMHVHFLVLIQESYISDPDVFSVLGLDATDSDEKLECQVLFINFL